MYEQETQDAGSGSRVFGSGIIGLITSIKNESKALIQDEIVLARKELGREVNRLEKRVVALVSGAGVAMVGAIFLLLALTAGIFHGLVAAEVSPYTSAWLAPLITGLTITILGFIVFMGAKNRLTREGISLDETSESLKETKAWLQHRRVS